MTQNAVNRHPADIQADVRKRGLTLASIARAHNISRRTVCKATHEPCLAGETAIAKALGCKPWEIWPNRYDKDGNPRHPRAHLQSNVPTGTDASQKSVA